MPSCDYWMDLNNTHPIAGNRYMRPPWVSCELESKELLALCLKKVTGLNKTKVVDAGFVWTEPHSRRLKVKLTIQKEIESGAKLQQSFIVEFTLQNQQCDVCMRSYTNNTWGTCVQLRQKVCLCSCVNAPVYCL
jgi:nonsense-mediated mRNA decay protein 3